LKLSWEMEDAIFEKVVQKVTRALVALSAIIYGAPTAISYLI